MLGHTGRALSIRYPQVPTAPLLPAEDCELRLRWHGGAQRGPESWSVASYRHGAAIRKVQRYGEKPGGCCEMGAPG